MRLTYPLRRLLGAALGASLAALMCIVIAGALVGAHHIAVEIMGERNAP